MADFMAKHSGTWKTGEPWAKHSGTWKKAQEVWQKQSGSWVRIWQGISADLSGLPGSVINFEFYPGPSVASVTINSDGTWETSSGQSGTWLTGGTNSDFEIKATKSSGTAYGTYGSWLSLTSDRQWYSQQFGTGVQTATILLEIRNADTQEVLTSESINLSASVEI